MDAVFIVGIFRDGVFLVIKVVIEEDYEVAWKDIRDERRRYGG